MTQKVAEGCFACYAMERNMLLAVSVLLAFSAVLVRSDGTCQECECVAGFASLNHIEVTKGDAELREPDRRQVVFPSIRFACDGVILKWIIGAEWEGDPEAYTELQVWRRRSGSVYTKVGNTTVVVETQNSSKLYEYPLESPLAFQEGDILGYFQPENDRSELSLYSRNSEALVGYHNYVNEHELEPPTEPFDISTADGDNNNYPLITVVTDPPDSGCGFMSLEIINRLLGNQNSAEDSFEAKQLIMPNMRFTCSGEIVKWIMGGEWSNDERKQHYPELQVWRPSSGTIYQKVDSTNISAAMEMNSGVYEFVLDSPIPFQAGDVVGVFQPSSDNSRLRVNYDDHGNSVYHYMETGENEVVSPYTTFDTDDDDNVESQTGLPLVTVEIATYAASPAVTLTTSSATLPATASITPTKTATRSLLPSALLPSPSTSQNGSSQGAPKISDKSSLDSGAIAGIVLSLVVMLLLVAIATVTIIVLVTQKRKYDMNTKRHGVLNPTYEEDLKMVKYSKEASTEGVEILDSPATLVNYHEDTSVIYATPDTPADYEVPQQQEASGKWGIYVPTKDQRSMYQEIDNIYSYADLKPVVKDSSGVGGEENSFFTKSDIYWVPASNPAELYEQLSKYRFREIQRDQIRIVEHLGSGHFGTVNKGFWKCPKGEVEVAIKVLQPGASEDDRVKFLQEAAIMGQFSHPNVVSLHGVVTLGEPVMIVMELMENGDLRDYLINLRPNPGEMVSDALCQQLLELCHQVSAGMRYLSDKAFVHRDIAARNILVSGNICKIADFGMARNLEESDYYTSRGGQIPIKWTAPEALNYKKYSTASDVWSFGCLMYEIWSLGHKPFEGYTNMETLNKVTAGWRLPPPPGCPKEIYHLMIQCWHPDASARPQFAQLLEGLSCPEHELLVPEDEGRVHPQATLLGAPLEAGSGLYPELQNTYIK